MGRLQRGFTLIEVMIIVAIIAILAAIALSSIQEYVLRTKMSEVILALSGCRTTVSEIYQGAGSSAPGPNGWGCESAAAQSKYVSKVETSANGAVTATVQGIGGGLDGTVVTLIPLNAAGVPVERRDYDGVVHEFFGMGAVVAKAREAMEYAVVAEMDDTMSYT